MTTLRDVLEQRPRILWAFSEAGIDTKGIRIADCCDDLESTRYISFILPDQEYQKLGDDALKFSHFLSCMLDCGVIISSASESRSARWLELNSISFDKKSDAKLTEIFDIESLEKDELEKIDFDVASSQDKLQKTITINQKELSLDNWSAVDTDAAFSKEQEIQKIAATI